MPPILADVRSNMLAHLSNRPPGLAFSSLCPESVKRIIFVRGLLHCTPWIFKEKMIYSMEKWWLEFKYFQNGWTYKWWWGQPQWCPRENSKSSFSHAGNNTYLKHGLVSLCSRCANCYQGIYCLQAAALKRPKEEYMESQDWVLSQPKEIRKGDMKIQASFDKIRLNSFTIMCFQL